MTLKQFINSLKDTDNNIFNINVYDEEDLGKVYLEMPDCEEKGEFYLNMISEKTLNSEIKNMYFSDGIAEITVWTGPKINKQGELIK